MLGVDMKRIALLTLALLASCASYTETKLATFTAARKLPQTVADCPVIERAAYPRSMPSATPYAVITGRFGQTEDEFMGLYLKERALELGWAPDFLIYQRAGDTYAGSISNYIGFGVSMSTPAYNRNASVVCCRLASAYPGFRINDSAMVTWVSEETRASGLQEGDTVVSVDGAEIVSDVPGAPSPWHAAKLRLMVGQEVEVIWIRPGTGRMQGSFKMQEQPPMPDTSESLDKRALAKREAKRRRFRRLGRERDEGPE